MAARKRAPRQPIQVSPEPWEGAWHLDKRIPVALIVTMFLQLGAGLWWASQINADVQFLKLELGALKSDLKQKDEKFQQLSALTIELRNVSASIIKVEKTIELLRDKMTDQQIRNSKK